MVSQVGLDEQVRAPARRLPRASDRNHPAEIRGPGWGGQFRGSALNSAVPWLCRRPEANGPFVREWPAMIWRLQTFWACFVAEEQFQVAFSCRADSEADELPRLVCQKQVIGVCEQVTKRLINQKVPQSKPRTSGRASDRLQEMFADRDGWRCGRQFLPVCRGGCKSWMAAKEAPGSGEEQTAAISSAASIPTCSPSSRNCRRREAGASSGSKPRRASRRLTMACAGSRRSARTSAQSR